MQKDISFKRLFRIKENFAQLCNALIFKGAFVIDPECLEECPTESFEQTLSGTRQLLRDLLMVYKPKGNKKKTAKKEGKCKKNRARTAAIRLMFIGLEHQSVPDYDMGWRVLRYNLTNIRDQFSAEHPSKPFLMDVITAVIYVNPELNWNAPDNFLGYYARSNPVLEKYRINTTIPVVDLSRLACDELANLSGDLGILTYQMNYLNKHHRFDETDTRPFKHPNELGALLGAFLHNFDGEDAAMECNNEYGEVNMEYFMRHFLEKTKKEAIAEARPAIMADAEAEIIAKVRPRIIAEAKPDIIAEAKPNIIAEAKPNIIAEAKNEAAIDAARKMLSLNIAMPLIAQVTSLSMDEIMLLSKTQTD